MGRKKTETTTEEPSAEDMQPIDAVEEPPSGEPVPLPALEAFAEAMAQTTHQHLSATPEDAPRDPVQTSLFPRPPFDHRAALLTLSEKEREVADLAGILESAKRAHKSAKDDWDEASSQLAKLIRETVAAMRDSERAADGERLKLHMEGCAWERENPGEVCMVCAQARAALSKEKPVDERFVGQPCANCGETSQGHHAIHRDGLGLGPEVPLCDACGSGPSPTEQEIWARIAQPQDEPASLTAGASAAAH